MLAQWGDGAKLPSRFATPPSTQRRIIPSMLLGSQSCQLNDFRTSRCTIWKPGRDAGSGIGRNAYDGTVGWIFPSAAHGSSIVQPGVWQVISSLVYPLTCHQTYPLFPRALCWYSRIDATSLETVVAGGGANEPTLATATIPHHQPSQSRGTSPSGSMAKPPPVQREILLARLLRLEDTLRWA